jgi:hypothetical protein
LQYSVKSGMRKPTQKIHLICEDIASVQVAWRLTLGCSVSLDALYVVQRE